MELMRFVFLVILPFVPGQGVAQTLWLEAGLAKAQYLFTDSGTNEWIDFEYGIPVQGYVGLQYRLDSNWSVIGNVARSGSNARYKTTYSNGSITFFDAPDLLTGSLQVAYSLFHGPRTTSRIQAGLSISSSNGYIYGYTGRHVTDTTKPIYIISDFTGLVTAMGLSGQYSISYRVGQYLTVSTFISSNSLISKDPLQLIETRFVERSTGNTFYQLRKHRKTQFNFGIGFSVPL